MSNVRLVSSLLGEGSLIFLLRDLAMVILSSFISARRSLTSCGSLLEGCPRPTLKALYEICLICHMGNGYISQFQIDFKNGLRDDVTMK